MQDSYKSHQHDKHQQSIFNVIVFGAEYYSGCTQLEQTSILVLNSIQYTCKDLSSIDDSKDL